MRRRLVQVGTKALVLLAFSAYDCSASRAVRAQGTPAAQSQIGMRERTIRSLELGATSSRREPEEVLAEVNEDLSRLKKLSEDISTYGSATDPTLTYNSIVADVTEIKKRAMRLRTDLALPKEENKDKGTSFKEAEKGELQPGLAALKTLIGSFLHNPIFVDAGIPDVRLAAKAKRDLDEIIVLSDKLRKNADRRSKTGGKNQ